MGKADLDRAAGGRWVTFASPSPPGRRWHPAGSRKVEPPGAFGLEQTCRSSNVSFAGCGTRAGRPFRALASRPDSRGEAAAAYRRLYKTSRWQAIRRAQLAEFPLCCMCIEREIVTAAEVVDHVVPHRGDEDLFWSGPFQSLCKPHHDSTKQRIELGQEVITFGADGWPVG